MKKKQLYLSKLTAAVIAVLAHNAAEAASFSLYDLGTVSAIGNTAAGIAAEAADASTGWYNPAGLALLDKQQMILGGIGVLPSAKLTGTSTFSTPNYPPYIQSYNNLQGAKNVLVPSFYYALPLGERATVGVSIVSPFGLSTEWDTGSPVRYASTFSELLTADLSPEIGARLTDNFAVGAGLDLQWARVKFNSVLGSPAQLQLFQQVGFPATPTSYDSLSYNKGHSIGIGFHAGVMGIFNANHSRIGLNYQSGIRHKFNGYSELRGPLADPALRNPYARFHSSNLYSNDIKWPDIITLSGYQEVSDRVALLGSVVYSGWSTLKSIQLNNAAAYAQGIGQVKTNVTSVQNYRNAWRASLGVNYHYNEKLMLRAGAGYSPTPTVDAHRDIRIPDADRWLLGVGAHYQMRPNIGVDVGYMYLFGTNDGKINRTDSIGPSTYNINAKSKIRANLVGLQAVWNIDQIASIPTK